MVVIIYQYWDDRKRGVNGKKYLQIVSLLLHTPFGTHYLIAQKPQAKRCSYDNNETCSN